MQEQKDHPFSTQLVNLASSKLGGLVVYATDEFFASKERLIKDEDPIFITDKYDDHGKWMDGWESRRRRDGGYDYSIIKLATSGIIQGVDINTAHFTGNHPPYASLEAMLSDDFEDKSAKWVEILPKTTIKADSHNFFKIKTKDNFSFIRLNIFPDGGVARLRTYGRPNWNETNNHSKELVELTSILNGGYVVGYNDAHYGNPWVILAPGRGENMGDGWETRRRREPGNDWIIVSLAKRGKIEQIEIDTAYFKGNYPDRCTVEYADIKDVSDTKLLKDKVGWKALLGEKKLEMDCVHNFYQEDLTHQGPATHLRLSIYPDGGISRFRAFGSVVDG